MAELCGTFDEQRYREVLDHFRCFVLLTRDRKSICRVVCSKPLLAILHIWDITKFVMEEHVPSGLHCTSIHPSYEDKRQRHEWRTFLHFLQEYKKAAFVNSENGEIYILPSYRQEEYDHAVVHYSMHDHGGTRSNTHVKSENIIENERIQSESPKKAFEDMPKDNVHLQSKGQTPSRSVYANGPTKNYFCAHPSYLKTLGQTHSGWLFGAVAELVDNSRDAKATMLDIFIEIIYSSTDGKEIPMLAVVDDGHGMTHEEIMRMVSFGRKQPDTNDPNCIGRYGVGFKTGTMRLGRDALVLTQTTNSRSIAFLSQSLNEGKDNVEIPVVTYSRKEQFMELDTNIQSEASSMNNLKAITEFSPFNTYFVGEKMGLFHREGTGTQIFIWNLDKWGTEYSLEWVNGMKGGSSFHRGDIFIRSRRARSRLGQMTREVPLDYSLRSYLEVIFLDPRIKIKVQGSLVKSRPLAKFLHKTSIENSLVLGKQVELILGHSQIDLEQGNCGIFLYWHGRLIEAYKRVGSMIHNGEKSHGIVGVIDVTNIMDDSNGRVWVHNNKQGFVDCEPYALLEEWLSKKADEYLDNTIDKVHVKEGGPSYKPDHEWVQCNKCRKWRMLDSGFDTKTLPQEWFCYMKPFNGKCEMPEEKAERGVITTSSYRTENKGEDDTRPLKRLRRGHKRL